MSLDSPTFKVDQAAGLRIAFVAARFNNQLVEALLDRGYAAVEQSGASVVAVERVPGSAELPVAAALLVDALEVDAIVVLGVVIQGDTDHHRIIGDSTAHALTKLSVERKLPIINGILVTNTLAQAEERAHGAINRGTEFANSALEMAAFKRKWTK